MSDLENSQALMGATSAQGSADYLRQGRREGQDTSGAYALTVSQVLHDLPASQCHPNLRLCSLLVRKR